MPKYFGILRVKKIHYCSVNEPQPSFQNQCSLVAHSYHPALKSGQLVKLWEVANGGRCRTQDDKTSQLLEAESPWPTELPLVGSFNNSLSEMCYFLACLFVLTHLEKQFNLIFLPVSLQDKNTDF
eukprot:TRINITY_DN13388_c0_g1_i1.p1 TRINITY_DN13388_c0_g1~~TRINITY_DN13388_c0_g1_i1.p1  ORF type:complete len:125 (-),score=15.68 TRINITY_DN13388_c0_g1_i1:520-894(-)